MKTILFLIMVGTLAQAQDLALMKSRYQAASQAIMAQGFCGYTNGLQDLKVQAQQRGDLDTLRVVVAEIKRTQTDHTLGTNQAPAVVGLATRQEQISARRVVDLTSHYVVALYDLQVRLTKAGDLDGATAAQQEGEAARFILAEAGARAPAEPAAAPTTNQVVAAPKLTKPHKDIGEQILGKWSMDGGYFELLPDGVLETTWGTGTWVAGSNTVIATQNGFAHELTLTGPNSAKCRRSDGHSYTMKRIK